MRPKYERERDRVNQRLVADHVVATHPGARWVELPVFDHVDFELWKAGKLAALLEVKHRMHPSNTYGDYAIGAAKWRAMIERGGGAGVPVFFAAHFSDRALWTPVVDGGFTVCRGGRQDRGDAGDLELMLHVPWKEFRTMRGLPGHNETGPPKRARAGRKAA